MRAFIPFIRLSSWAQLVMEVPFCAESPSWGRQWHPVLTCVTTAFPLLPWQPAFRPVEKLAFVWTFLEEGGHQAHLSKKHISMKCWQADHLLGSLRTDGEWIQRQSKKESGSLVRFFQRWPLFKAFILMLRSRKWSQTSGLLLFFYWCIRCTALRSDFTSVPQSLPGK